MKKTILGASLLFLSFFAHSQNGLENVVVEKYYVANAADAAGSVGNLPVGSVTYRVYADMLPGYKFQALYGVSSHELKITTSTTFFNNEDRGASVPNGITLTNLKKNTVMLDSWFSVGGAGSGKMALLKTEDSDGSVGNSNGILQNNDATAGIPINSGATPQDGMINGSPEAVTFVGLDLNSGNHALDLFDATSQFGGTFSTFNGSIASLNGSSGPTAANRVLLGQFTTEGTFGFELNIQIGTPTGGTQQFVARNPVGSEIQLASLKLAPNLPPTVSVTSPSNGANIVIGSSITLAASANDADGTITSVEFFVDGVSKGVDNTSPYNAAYTITAGTHTVTARATDDNAPTPAQTTSSNVVINGVTNPAPTVSLTAPTNGSTYIAPDVVNITATATDDISVASVEFFVDGSSIGIVSGTGPYAATYTSVVGPHSLTARATDNLGAQTTSAAVTITVNANVAPSVSISATPSSAFANPTATFTVSATATDIDGSVASVEFFDGVTSLGVDNSAPYSAVLTTTVIGAHSLTARATDDRGTTTTSASTSVSVLDASFKYNVGTIVATCIPTGFCIPVNALSAVSNVIGYDMVLHYNKTKVRPVLTGTIVVPAKGTALIPAADVDFETSLDSVNGVINISEFLNGFGGTPTFSGTGQLFCINFTKTAGFLNADTAIFTITNLQESYYNGVSVKQASPGKYITYRDTAFNARLDYWNGNGPLAYNSGNPAQYLITQIYGKNTSCTGKSSVFVTPNLTGNFVYSTNNGLDIDIERDILSSTDVQPVINGFDATIARQLLANTLANPSVYQVIAMDVNRDGTVSSGDVSQINQRTVLSIPEFRQAWNYDFVGNPIAGKGKSKDWLFLDSAKVSTYGTFPTGYSKSNVPVLDTCIVVPVLNYNTCPSYTSVPTYKGIMIGDVNGNFAGVGSGGLFRLNSNSNDKVIFDMTKAIVNGSYLDVPVSIASYDDIKSLDFALQFNESNLAFNSIIENTNTMQTLSHYNAEDKTLRFTSSSLENIEKNKALVSVRFTMLSTSANASDLKSVTAYLNGERVKATTETTVAGTNSLDVNVYPNPANEIMYVESPEQVKVQLLDMQGRQVIEGKIVNAYEKQAIDVQNVASGIYIMKISNNSSVTTKKVLINK